MGLVEPQSNGIGGDLFAIVYEAKTGRLHGLNAGGWAPAGLTPALLKSEGSRADAAGRHSHRDRAGRRRRLGGAAHAARHAAAARICWRRRSSTPNEGFPVSDVIAAHWAALADKLAAEPNAAATYLPDGRAPRAGEIFRNPDLAASLRRIATHGRGGFLRGPTAEAILAISTRARAAR